MDDVETGRRLRAARGYAGLDADDVAKALSFSVSTLYRTESGKRPLADAEKRRVAEFCGLPVSFFSIDFANDGAGGELGPRVGRLELLLRELDPADTRTRLRNVESQVASLVGAVSRLEDETRQLERDAREREVEALERETEAAVERDETRRGRSASSERARDDRTR